MKLWEKVYFLTLILFLVLINCGIYLVFQMTYEKDITVEKRKAQSTFQMLESSLTRNMMVLDDGGRLGESQVRLLLETYEKYYKVQDITLKIWKDDTCIYPSEKEEKKEELFREGKKLLTVFSKGKMKNVCITNRLDGFSEQYDLYYEQPLTELYHTWNELQRRYVFMSLVFSILLAFILLFVLQRLMKPISELSIAVEKMKNGTYDIPCHVTVKGRDDIAKLGESFNEMADTISDKVLQIQEEARKKQEFVDNFAHELKSPLTSIYGFAEYVGRAKISDEEKEECMDFIMEESNRMLQLSYTLLDMSKLREKSLSMEPIDTNKLCEKIQLQLGDQIEKKKIQFSVKVGTSQIYGNELLLQSLISNFIVNAIHACEMEGKIELVINKNDKESTIIVSDNGCGMTEDECKHITEPFYRVDKARSRENGGTGLGLSLCRQIVIAHNGTLNFDSHIGEGTKVTVTFSV